MIFSPFTNLGLNEIIVGELVKGETKEKVTLGSSFYLKLGSGILGISICNIMAFFLGDSIETRFLIFLYSIFFLFKSLDGIDYFYLSRNKVTKLALYRSIGIIISILLKILLILLNVEWEWFVYLSSFELMLYGVIYLIYYKLDGQKLNWEFDKSNIKKVALISTPLFFILVFNMLQIRVDHLMISKILGVSSLGEYSVVVKIGEILNFLPLVVSASLYPKLISSLEDKNEEVVKRWTSLYFGSFFIIAFGIFAGLFTLGGPGVSLLYGIKYQLAPELIGKYAFQLFFSYLFLAQSRFFLARNKLRFFLPLSFLSVLTNIVLNLLLIPKFGVAGAIWASAISYCIPSAIGVFFNQEIRTSLIYYFDVISFYKQIRKGLN